MALECYYNLFLFIYKITISLPNCYLAERYPFTYNITISTQ